MRRRAELATIERKAASESMRTSGDPRTHYPRRNESRQQNMVRVTRVDATNTVRDRESTARSWHEFEQDLKQSICILCQPKDEPCTHSLHTLDDFNSQFHIEYNLLSRLYLHTLRQYIALCPYIFRIITTRVCDMGFIQANYWHASLPRTIFTPMMLAIMLWPT
jgi:hypothetical protein